MAASAAEPNRIWAVINSPIVLLSISAVFLSSAGFYFTNTQQCFHESSRIQETFSHLEVELMTRRRAQLDGVIAAQNFEEAKLAIRIQANVYADFKANSSRELEEQLDRLSVFILWDAAHSPFDRQSWIFKNNDKFSYQENLAFRDALNGWRGHPESADFSRFRQYVGEILMERPRIEWRSRCGSPPVLLEYALTGTAQILSATQITRGLVNVE